jgi:hypothetical protein
MKQRVDNLVLMALIVLLCAGCSTFSHEWKTASQETALPEGLKGRWEGTWVSDVNGHTDELKCVTKQNTDGTYRARFHAKYRKVLSFGYTVALTAQPRDGGFIFQGSADLGWYAGGLYHYEGRADATNLTSTYTCKYDHGTFHMGRVGSGV